MDSIRSACVAYWGKVPMLDTYRQMASRRQKQHDYSQALWWAERTVALYGDCAARPEAVEDMRKRAVSYRTKMEREIRAPSSATRPPADRNLPRA